jgi:hypothetical protein
LPNRRLDQVGSTPGVENQNFLATERMKPYKKLS